MGVAPYPDDGPPEIIPANLAAIPDASPRAEPVVTTSLRPYEASGQRYVPLAKADGYRERGEASWYGRKFHGRKTSSGEAYDMFAMTAAHRTLPIPSYVRVTNPRNGKSVIVRINDRGPFLPGRVIDLSFAAAYKLDTVDGISAPVQIEALDPDVENSRLAAAPASSGAEVGTPPETTAATSSEKTDRATAANKKQAKALASRAQQIYLQLAAFHSLDNALAAKARLSPMLDSAVSAPIELVPLAGTWKLRAGPFADRAQAQTAAEKIRTTIGTPVFEVAR
jgi:rare lipoprotein A